MHALAAALLVFSVAPSGDDAGPGTAVQPWRTISKAARSVPPGSVVDVRAGTYHERVQVLVSGTAGAPIAFRTHPGERVAISGAGLRPAARGTQAGLVDVRNRSHLSFEGFELRDWADRAARERFTPAGVWVSGAGTDITLRGLDVHGIRTRRGNAHGIAVYGTSATRPLSAVRIESSNVHDLVLGFSEAVVVNGNVDDWSITGNTVDDVNNIGIDAIGFEGTAPRRGVDRARHGVISLNRVSDVDTLGNFAYRAANGELCRCAGGIYVDGGADILIERNRVTRSNLGVELASESPTGTTSDVTLRSNSITSSDRAGLTIGGYDTHRGRTLRALVVGNTFSGDDRLRDGVGEVELNHGVVDSRFLDNSFRARPGGILLTNQFTTDRGNVFDGNTWFSPGRTAAAARWQWRGRAVSGFAAWRRVTGGEARGRYADPLAPAG